MWHSKVGGVALVLVASCSSFHGGEPATSSGGNAGNGGSGGSGGSGGRNAGGGSAGKATAGSGGSSTSGGGSGGSGGSSTSVGGWRPFNDQSPWNTAIPDNPGIDPDSATMIADLIASWSYGFFYINSDQYSVPVYWIDSSSTATVNVTSTLGGTGFRVGSSSDSDAAGSGPAPIPSGATPADGSDKHLAVVDRTANMEWGFWSADHGSGSWTAGEASTMDLSGDGVRPPEVQDPWWAAHGPRACGFALIAGLITADDVKAGAIDHALVVAYPHIRSRYYTPPASTAQSTGGTAQANRGIPCGGHVQLDPSLDVTTLGLNATGLMIARALQTYGAFVGDLSGSISLYAEAGADALSYWNTGVLDGRTADAIPLSSLRVLTLGTQYDSGH
jgi:hypothetical protein